MASPAVAIPNGIPEPSHHDVDMADAPAHPTMKRKREPSINGVATSHHSVTTNGISHPTEDEKSAIRDYLLVLERFDANPSLLKRPLPELDASDEPSAKRKKSDDGFSPLSIAEKAAKHEYADLEAVVTDIKSSIKDQLAELRAVEGDKDTKANDEAVAKTIAFGQKAQELFRRETSYPHPIQNVAALKALDPQSDVQSTAIGNMVLSVYGEAPRPRQLYSSLQQRVVTTANPQGSIQPLRETGLPSGIKTAKAIPFSFPSAVEKDKKAKTLGELFPAPRGLPSLQPPKAPKSTTKGVQVGWHRPELTEKSKYRTGSYFGQNISTGRWLDYSNAAPPSQIMTKQRERAMSLAGAKPSSSDLETTEMEALFRGAFSSFAPSKDDSAAMVSSGLVSQTMWWQKYGKRSFDRLVEPELPEEVVDVGLHEDVNGVALDDDLIKEAIETWDSKIDPKLEEMCNPKKTEAEKDVDDILQEVTDMIQTLVSFQKNRNLVLPTASNPSRYATDPAHSDMLTNGTPVQPSEEETLTYETLKAQLVLIIQMLPPYAVARLNSDKLEELNISTKLEIRADEYQGLMEEDETAARARASQQATAGPRPTAHRSSSSSSSLQYGSQYQGGNRAPMPSPGFYSQTPARPPPTVQRPPPNMTPSYPQQRPSSNTGYRPTNGYAANSTFAQQLARSGPSYSQSSPYGATPPQSRPPYQQQQPPSYHNMGATNPPPRYPSAAPAAQSPSFQQHAYQQQHHQTPGTPSHAPYHPYTNGAANMPPRTVSPQVAHQQPQFMAQQGLNHAATPSRPASYGGQPPTSSTPQPRFYPPAGSPQMQQSNPNQSQHNPQQVSSFHTSLNQSQVQQAIDQARVRFNAQSKAQQGPPPIGTANAPPPITAPPSSASPVGPPVGLSGIGLGGVAAAARPALPGGANYNTPSPIHKPQSNSPAMQPAPSPAVNGTSTGAAAIPAATNGTQAEPNRQA